MSGPRRVTSSRKRKQQPRKTLDEKPGAGKRAEKRKETLSQGLEIGAVVPKGGTLGIVP